MATTHADILVTAIQKGPERYILMYRDTRACRDSALCFVEKWAKADDLAFDWFDAASMAEKIDDVDSPPARCWAPSLERPAGSTEGHGSAPAGFAHWFYLAGGCAAWVAVFFALRGMLR
jgi:hypothetical protein